MVDAKYHRDWYHQHKDKLKPIKAKRNRDLRKVNRQFLNAFKVYVGCKKCGYDEHPQALQFHHRNRRTKKFDISTAAGRHSISTILTEIKKCDVLCANCHAIVESKQGI